MRLPIVVILLAALVGAAGAKTLTIHTDPEGGSVWHRAAYLGKAPVIVEVTPGTEYEITIKGKTEYARLVEINESDSEQIVVLSAKDTGGFKWEPFIWGLGASIVGMFVVLFIIPWASSAYD